MIVIVKWHSFCFWFLFSAIQNGDDEIRWMMWSLLALFFQILSRWCVRTRYFPATVHWQKEKFDELKWAQTNIIYRRQSFYVSGVERMISCMWTELATVDQINGVFCLRFKWCLSLLWLMCRHVRLTTTVNATTVMQMPSMIGMWTNQLSSLSIGLVDDVSICWLKSPVPPLSSGTIDATVELLTMSSSMSLEVDVAGAGAVVVVVELLIVTFDLAHKHIRQPRIGSRSSPFRQCTSQFSWSWQYILPLISHTGQHWPGIVTFFSQLIGLHMLMLHKFSPFSLHSQCVHGSSSHCSNGLNVRFRFCE